MSPPLKPGDLVRTPLMRAARVEGLRPDGKRDLRYLDTGEELVLHENLLRLIDSAGPVRWPTHK